MSAQNFFVLIALLGTTACSEGDTHKRADPVAARAGVDQCELGNRTLSVAASDSLDAATVCALVTRALDTLAKDAGLNAKERIDTATLDSIVVALLTFPEIGNPKNVESLWHIDFVSRQTHRGFAVTFDRDHRVNSVGGLVF